MVVLTQSIGAQTPGALPREQLPKTRALDYEFQQVRIATILNWLRRVGVEPPVALSGTVSGWLWAQAPSSGWWKLGDYRVEGEVTSDLLGVDQYAIRQARVRFGYQQGLWSVGNAEGLIASRLENEAERELGSAKLSATLPNNTRANAHIEGQLGGVSLVNLLETFGLKENIPQGLARATFRIDTPLVDLSSPLMWKASGRIEANDVKFASLEGLTAASDWILSDSELELQQTRVTLASVQSQSLQLAGRVTLRDAFAWQVQLPAQPLQLNSNLISQLIPAGVPLDTLPTGSLQLSGTSGGTLSPWGAQYALQIANGQLQWSGNTLANVNSQLSLGPKGLALDSLTLQTAGGSMAGAALFTGELEEPFSVTLNYQDIDLASVRAPIELPVMTGRVSGRARVSIDKRRMTEVESLSIDLRGEGQAVRVGDWGLGNIEYKLEKSKDNSDVQIELQDAGQTRRWLASGQFTPQADNKSWRYAVDARGNALDLSIRQLIRLIGTSPTLPVPLEILLVTGSVTLKGDTTTGLDTTEFNFSNITTLERDRRVWSQGSMAGRTTRQTVEIDRSQFQVADSDLQASLKWHYLVQDQPNDATQENQPAVEDRAFDEDRLKLRIDKLKLETLGAWQIVQLPKTSDGRRPLDALISADVDLRRRPNARSWLTNWSGQSNLQLNELTLQGKEAGQLTLVGSLSPDRWQGKVTGDMLNAPVTGDAVVRLADNSDPKKAGLSVASATGKLSWLGADVSQLMGLWQVQSQAAQWRGLSSLRVQFDWQANGQKSGLAEIGIDQLAYRQRNIVRNVQATAALENDQVRLVRFDGGLGGGRVDLNGTLDLNSRRLEGVTLQLQRVSIAEVAQLVDPEWGQDLAGRADVRARVRIDNGLDVRGDARLHDVKLFGLPVNELHSGFELTSARDWSLMRLRTANARGRVFGGRADADLQARLGARTSMELRLRVDRGEVEQLSEWTGTSSVVGKGKFDAAVNLNSSNVRSLRDIRGGLELSFEHTDARTLPVADQLTRFVPLFGLPSTEFERGKMSATISQGDLRMRSLALWGKQLSVLGSGNVGMASGRLDMQLVIRTGGGLSQQVAANYLAQLAATAVPQVELLLQINRLIANRAIFLRVAGTTSKPVIQPQAARMIERALLRSLLETAAPFAATGLSRIE